MLVTKVHKIAVAIAFVVLTAWLLFGSFLQPPYQQAAERGDHGTEQRPKEITDSESIDDRLARYTLWLAIFTGALVLASIIQNFFLIRAEKNARLAAEAAKKSADASVLALRPWVSCEAKIASDLTYRSNGDPCITIRFILKNNGHSPAMGVRLIQWFHLLSPVHTHSIHAQQRIADLLKGLPAQEHGLLLFPGKTHVSDIELPISRIEIEKSIEDIKPAKHFFPELIGVVSYTYPLATHNPQTGFIYYLQQIVPTKISGFAFDLDEPIVAAENITLRAHGLWSEYAT
jgi:hypothetical protein